MRRGRHVAARQQRQRADDAGDEKTEQHFGQLQREQGRQIRPGHVGHRHQRAIEHFLPRLLEEGGEIGQGAERVARRDDRPRPDQAHDEVAEDKTRQQHVDDMDEPPDGFTRALGAEFVEEQRHETDHRVKQSEPAQDAAADRQTGAKADDQIVDGEGAGYSSASRPAEH